MNRSIKKSISVNELNYIFEKNNVNENERSRLIPDLFENPQNETIYLLKEDILTKEDIERTISGVINRRDCVLAIVNIFSVRDDLIIPRELKDLLFSNLKLAFFVGAGTSRLLGIPLWDDLANEVIDYLQKNNHINHTESSRLKSGKYTAKQIMSIFHQIEKNESSRKTFYEEHFKTKKNDFGNPYELLLKIENALAKPIVKISTNIDLVWERILKGESEKQKQIQNPQGQISKSRPFYTGSQYFDFTDEQKIAGDILYQIHGRWNQINSTIITTADYVRNYREEKGLKGFLGKLFNEYVVLFIGSGIQEFEILEHCLKQSQNKHFALIGTQLGEENLFRIQKTYFKEINIKAIPYYLDLAPKM